MQKFIEIVNIIVSKILIVLMAVIVLDVTWQVITRFILRNPSSYTEELAGFLLIWIGLLGASHALYTKAHLGIDVLTYKLTGVRQRIVEGVIYALVFLFALFVMVIGGYKLVALTLRLNQISPGLKIPMGYVYTVLPASGLLMMLYAAGFMFRALKGAGDHEPAHHVSVVE
ncbi:MAG TPA: TRAP transporter small permease [bacterium]|nr:TRAP transporter small permease [bacterium]